VVLFLPRNDLPPDPAPTKNDQMFRPKFALTSPYVLLAELFPFYSKNFIFSSGEFSYIRPGLFLMVFLSLLFPL